MSSNKVPSGINFKIIMQGSGTVCALNGSSSSCFGFRRFLWGKVLLCFFSVLRDKHGSSSSFVREEKRTQTKHFWSGYLRVGVFHVKGWGPKSSVCPAKLRETKLFGGISRDFAGISQGCPKSLRKKSLCSVLVP